MAGFTNTSGSRALGAAAASAVAMCLLAGPVQASPAPVPSPAKPYGKGYEQLSTAWLEWATSIPAATNPISDPDGSLASIGQRGKVWFVAGNQGGSSARTITMPVGKAVFLPLQTFFWVNTPELGDDPWSEEQESLVRTILDMVVDTVDGLTLEIDGLPVADARAAVRASSTVGTCNLPEDSLFPDANAGPHPCVADGYWALLPPMSAGQHTLHFAANVPDFYQLDVTIQLIVTP